MGRKLFISGGEQEPEIVFDTMLGITQVAFQNPRGQFNVWDGTDLTGIIDTINHPAETFDLSVTGHIVFSPDRETVWVTARRNISNVWEWKVFRTSDWVRIRQLSIAGRWGAWNPAGTVFAVSNNLGANQPTRLYNSNYSQIATFRHNTQNNTGGKLSFNSTGEFIATAHSDSRAFITRTSDWGLHFELDPAAWGSQDPIFALFHPTDPDILALGVIPGDFATPPIIPVVTIWDISTPPGTIIDSLTPALTERIRDMEFSPVGDRIAVATTRVDGMAKVYRTTDWDDTVGPSIGTFPAGATEAVSISWSSDGEKMAVAFEDNTTFLPANSDVNTYLTDAGFIFAGSPVPDPLTDFGQIVHAAWG